jgi:hypothetical protein
MSADDVPMIRFKYYNRMTHPDLLERLGLDGAPRVPDDDPLLAALRREFGPDGRPDIALQLQTAKLQRKNFFV